VYQTDRILALACVVALTAPVQEVAFAHAFSSSTSRTTVRGSGVNVVFTTNLIDHHAGPAIDSNGDGWLSVDEVDDAIEQIYAGIKENFEVTADKPLMSTLVERYQLIDENVLQLHIAYTFAEPVTRVTITSTMDRITQENHRHLARVGFGEAPREDVLDISAPSVTRDAASSQTVGERITRFLTLGIEHIFTGYDHLAFLLGLLVTAATLGGLVNVVTSFTAAHSVTLGLATFGLVSLPTSLIESLIALSIAYVAIENLLRKRITARWRVTFLFGLVHGFGFSNVLREMELPRQDLALALFTFNAGVEVGQVLFVIAVFPILVFFTKRRMHPAVLGGCSAAILCLGVYWFVQRAFLS
jgi:hydrogenase/urease accessory protein HupE